MQYSLQYCFQRFLSRGALNRLFKYCAAPIGKRLAKLHLNAINGSTMHHHLAPLYGTLVCLVPWKAPNGNPISPCELKIEIEN